MGSGRGLRMVLDRKNGIYFVLNPFNCVVVKVNVRGPHGFMFYRVHINRKTMVFRCNINLAGTEFFYRLVCAPVSEFELVCFSAIGKAEQLLAKTDAEYGDFSEKLPDFLYRIRNTFRVTGTVGEKHPIAPHG